MIPRTREEKIQWIREHVIPVFESQLEEIPEEEPDQEKIDRSEQILAEEYLDEGSGAVRNVLKVALLLVIIDMFTHMPPQVYGLVFSIVGTGIMLVEADILGSTSIAARSRDTLGGVVGGFSYLDEAEARRLARNTVITNVGLVWLFTGFVMQIVAAWFVPSETLIQPVNYGKHLANPLALPEL